MPESQCVIDTYLRHCARGRTLPKGFEEKLVGWLQDVNRPQQISPRKKLYWTLPAYAAAHKLHPQTFCKRFREMEKIAKKLFPLRVPAHRVDVELSDEKKQAIRDRFSVVQDFHKVADEFGIEAFRVGQLCREEKAALIDAREQSVPAGSKVAAPNDTSDLEPPY